MVTQIMIQMRVFHQCKRGIAIKYYALFGSETNLIVF